MRDYLELAGRRFPTVGLICPESPSNTDEYDRAMGLVPTDTVWYIPVENGVLVHLEKDDEGDWHVYLYARACEQDPFCRAVDEPPIWLPIPVCIYEGELQARPSPWRPKEDAPWYWDHAEESWLCEHLDRISRMHFKQPEGPQVQLVSRSEWLERNGYGDL